MTRATQVLIGRRGTRQIGSAHHWEQRAVQNHRRRHCHARAFPRLIA
jgi:hypothetical protein